VTPSPDLQRIREAIEGVDREVLALLRRRMDLVESIVQAKLDAAVPFRDRLREEQVLTGVRHLAAEAGLDPHEVERLYRQIMEMSIAVQQHHIRNLPGTPLRVGYQGVEGSYSHLTAQRRYAGRQGGVLLTGYEDFRRAARAVIEGRDDLALLPIENTTAGSINDTYDLLAEGGITIVAEVVSRIEHCLLGLPGAGVESLRSVLSHQQGILQCREFLDRHPWIEPRVVFDTAGAARRVKQGNDPTAAAIAGEAAAGVYGLAVLARGIQSQTGNYTRFVEVAREGAACPPGAVCKTSLLLVLGHRPGALGEVLRIFAEHGVNLTKIESRPIAGHPWEYRFYLDLEGHRASAAVGGALEAVEPIVAEVRVLGTYPAAGPEPSDPGNRPQEEPESPGTPGTPRGEPGGPGSELIS
jgi:chorismate mutase/prephenate dehydratase